MKKVYIAGPMSGIKDWNRPAFEDAAKRWRAAGWEVCNPIEEDDKRGGPDVINAEPGGWNTTLRRDIAELVGCDAIALLPGWDASRGATLEYNVAQRTGLDVYDAITMEKKLGQEEPGRESVCYEAMALVFGARRWSYGHPFDNFKAIHRYWAAHLDNAVRVRGKQLAYTKDEVEKASEIVRRTFLWEDVAPMMIQTKQAREMNTPKRDNLVDTCGYAEAQWQALEEQKKRKEA